LRVTVTTLFEFDNTYRRDLAELGIEWKAAPAPEPHLVVLNDALAVELGVDPAALRSDEGVAVLAGNAEPAGSETRRRSCAPARRDRRPLRRPP
jgi:uncharacterized protein YdiU (UPF0061 family)